MILHYYVLFNFNQKYIFLRAQWLNKNISYNLENNLNFVLKISKHLNKVGITK